MTPSPEPSGLRTAWLLRLAALRRWFLSRAGVVVVSTATGALLSWTGLVLWWQFGHGPQAVLPAAVLPAKDPRTGKIQPPLTFANRQAFERALSRSLETVDLPSVAERAARQIMPSVVHIRVEKKSKKKSGKSGNSGSGVVIKQDGTVLTNLHVVAAAVEGKASMVLTFADGSETPGKVVNIYPDKDLAIVKPERIPDDLEPAVLAGSRNLQPGDLG
ncbi:MAG: serine protease, partial [Quisquiliibacterium sp.]